MKKVSVIIPAYNRAGLIVKTVDSVLKQTYPNIETIIVDDGSTDNTRQCLIPYADKIKYVYKENGGACSARNLGIRLASGEYIGFLDSDDMYLPNKIEASVRYLERNPDCGFVHTAAYYINEDGIILHTYSPHKNRSIGWIAKKILLRNSICNGTVVIRKSCFEKIGYFDEDIFVPADWDMWLRLAEQYKAGYIDVPSTMYRVSGSYMHSHLEQSEREQLIVLEKSFKRNVGLKLYFRNKVISNIYRRHAIGYLLINDYDKAKDKLILAVWIYIFNLKAWSLLISVIVLRKKLNLIMMKYFQEMKLFRSTNKVI